jgi:stress-induced morphogen
MAGSKIKELETLLARNRETGGGDEALKQELAMLINERDEITERLKEFEIISDDLANLKRLQQENEQLKRSLAAVQGQENFEEKLPVSSNENLNLENVSNIFEGVQKINVESLVKNDQGDQLNNLSALPQETETPQPMASVEDKNLAQEEKSKTEKTPEDLLSEFEKMLG